MSIPMNPVARIISTAALQIPMGIEILADRSRFRTPIIGVHAGDGIVLDRNRHAVPDWKGAAVGSLATASDEEGRENHQNWEKLGHRETPCFVVEEHAKSVLTYSIII